MRDGIVAAHVLRRKLRRAVWASRTVSPHTFPVYSCTDIENLLYTLWKRYESGQPPEHTVHLMSAMSKSPSPGASNHKRL